MINQMVAGAVGIAQGTMVSYIISFLFSVGVVYLTVLGAVKLWDLVFWSYQALKTDIKAADAEGVGLFKYWKARVNAARPNVDRID